MMIEFAVAEEMRQHDDRTRCQGLVDKRLLSFERLDGRAAGQFLLDQGSASDRTKTRGDDYWISTWW